MSIDLKQIQSGETNGQTLITQSGSVIWSDENIYISNSVFVDATYGNDTTGTLEQPNRPFLTIYSAITAVHQLTGETYNIVVNNGTYTNTETLNSQPNKNYNILCESVDGVIINNSASSFMAESNSTGLTRTIEVKKGTWNHSGSGVLFSGVSKNDYYFYESIINNTAGLGIFHSNTTKYISNCRANSTANHVYYGTDSVSANTKTIVIDSYINSLDYVCSSDARIRIHHFNCGINSTNKGFINTNDPCEFSFQSCDIFCPDTAFSIKGCDIKFINSNSIRMIDTTGATAAISITGDTSDPKFIVIDNLTIRQHRLNNENCINTVNVNSKIDFGILNALHCTNPITTAYYGGIGCQFSSATPTNQINITLPFPYTANSITYTVQSGDTISSMISSIKSLIDAQVLITNTTWNLWTGAQVSRVETTADTIFIRGYGQTPQGFLIDTSNNYITENSSDISSNINENFSGLTNQFNGVVNVMSNNAIIFNTAQTRSIDFYVVRPNKDASN